jgi:hypothetical protein
LTLHFNYPYVFYSSFLLLNLPHYLISILITLASHLFAACIKSLALDVNKSVLNWITVCQLHLNPSA